MAAFSPPESLLDLSSLQNLNFLPFRILFKITPSSGKKQEDFFSVLFEWSESVENQ